MSDNLTTPATLFQQARKLRRALTPHFLSIAVFSFFVNILLLTGPLFMLQVYDRVLGSRSEETLMSLLILVIFLYVLMGLLDYVRGRIGARIGARFQAGLDEGLFRATLSRPDRRIVTDSEAVQRFMSSPALFALMDLPWAPLFIAVIFVFNVWLGVLALVGGLVLLVIAIGNRFAADHPNHTANEASQQALRLASEYQDQADMIRGLGMEGAGAQRWQAVRTTSLEAQIRASDVSGLYGTLSRTFRFFLQSAILALGALLVLRGQITAGAMIASSILMGRALAPVEQTIAHWPIIARARQGWASLLKYAAAGTQKLPQTRLLRPNALIEVQSVSQVLQAGQQPVLRGISFTLRPGQALGIIGPSASGKSTLARLLTGIVAPSAGKIRLDGATLDQYGEDLGRYVGYLPQDVTLFQGTVAENIARLAVNPDSEAVIAAAKLAGAHDMIVRFADGYDTVLSPDLMPLSGGQRQRIGLARALYGDPQILVLDEPNSNLDAEGSAALNQAIRSFKSADKAVIIMAHRPSGIAECDLLLVLQDGLVKALGPRDEVLRAQVANHEQVAQAIKPTEVT